MYYVSIESAKIGLAAINIQSVKYASSPSLVFFPFVRSILWTPHIKGFASRIQVLSFGSSNNGTLTKHPVVQRQEPVAKEQVEIRAPEDESVPCSESSKRKHSRPISTNRQLKREVEIKTKKTTRASHRENNRAGGARARDKVHKLKERRKTSAFSYQNDSRYTSSRAGGDDSNYKVKGNQNVLNLH
jgi:hypothetical protein